MIIDLQNYDVIEVLPEPVTLNTLNIIDNLAENLNFKDFVKEASQTKKEKVNFKNYNAIIAKENKKIGELKQKLYVFNFFVDYNIIKNFSLGKLEKLYEFVENLLNNTFIVKDKLHFYNKKKEEIKIVDKEMFNNYTELFLDNYKLYATEAKEKKDGSVEYKRIYPIDAKKFFNYIKINAPVVNNISINIDPFALTTTFKINKENKEVTLIKNKIMLKEPDKEILRAVGEEEKREILQSYKELWDGGEKLQEVLDFIVFGRFISARKELQLNVNAQSSWGKGFFMGVLEDLGIGLTIRQEDFKGDRPSGLNVQKLQNAVCLLIDEFKKYNNYLFNINNQMEIEEKFGARYKINVYARIFFNAQQSESLVGYINEQIVNRISFMQIKTKKLLINSFLYNKNKLIYKEVVKEYVYNYFKNKIDYLTQLGEIKAEEIADKRIQEIIKKYKLKAKNTDQLIVDTLTEFLEDFLDYVEHKEKGEQDIIYKKYTKTEVELFEKFIFYNKNNQEFYILKTEDTVIKILKERLQERDFKKVEYSRAEIKDILEKMLGAGHKVTYIKQLKASKRATLIKQKNIFKYKAKEEEGSREEEKGRENKNVGLGLDVFDLINANITYSTSLLKDARTEETERNKMLLLYALNSILQDFNLLNNLAKIYNTEDLNVAIASFIRDKAELLKKLGLYKTEDYFKTKDNNLPF